MEIRLPKYVKSVLRVLNAHEYPSCIVGGCVRDMILEVTPNDWDIATAARPEQVMALFPNSIPTGVRHGTVTVRSGSHFVEVTTFRTEAEYTDHRHPDVVTFVGDLSSDLSRRDFTINAIAITADGTVVDPYHGIDDLRRGVIRCVGSPDMRFDEDALRMFRAFRFSARLGFPIEEETLRAIRSNASLSSRLSAERVRDEIEKTLLTPHPELLFDVIDCGLLDNYLCAHLSRDTALRCIASLKRKSLPRWAAFSAALSADECIHRVDAFLHALRLDNRSIRCCSDAAEIISHAPPASPAEWKRLLAHFGVDAVECAAMCWDVFYSANFEAAFRKVLNSGECFSLKNLAVNGKDLAPLGFSGKTVGEMLNFLLDYVIDYPENNTRELLLALAATSGEE